jgi:hypothetical protein
VTATSSDSYDIIYDCCPRYCHGSEEYASFPLSTILMTLPISQTKLITVPRIDMTEPYTPKWRASTALRKISNPYSLAVPPHRQKRMPLERAPTPTTFLTRPDRITETLRTKRGVEFLNIPKSPKKAVVVSEKPIRATTGRDRRCHAVRLRRIMSY